MQPEATAPKPRVNRHLGRWLFVGILAVLGWSGWNVYDYRQAVKEAERLRWVLRYDDPIEVIRKDWRAAFRRKTWFTAERRLYIFGNSQLDGHYDLLHRLKPTELEIRDAVGLLDLSRLDGLSDLTELFLGDCSQLTNIDALKNLRRLTTLHILSSPELADIDALKELKSLTLISLRGCRGLTNVDALRDLKGLKYLDLNRCEGLENVDGILGISALMDLNIYGCYGLTKRTVDAVRTAFPNASISIPIGQ